jgi:phage terminase large subunit
LFLGTPAGKNQFYEMVQQARREPEWYSAEFKASETGIIAPEELAAARKDMTPDEYAQEYECSFEASVKGAIYGAEISRRPRWLAAWFVSLWIRSYLWIPTGILGVGDATAIWFSQSSRSPAKFALSTTTRTAAKGSRTTLRYSEQRLHLRPALGAVRHPGQRTRLGRSRLETAQSLGIRFQIAPERATRGRHPRGPDAVPAVLLR